MIKVELQQPLTFIIDETGNDLKLVKLLLKITPDQDILLTQINSNRLIITDENLIANLNVNISKGEEYLIKVDYVRVKTKEELDEFMSAFNNKKLMISMAMYNKPSDIEIRYKTLPNGSLRYFEYKINEDSNRV